MLHQLTHNFPDQLKICERSEVLDCSKLRPFGSCVLTDSIAAGAKQGD